MTDPTEPDIVLEPDIEPGKRLPGESAKAFEAFTVYRDLGPKRSITKAAEAMEPNPEKARKRVGTLMRWSGQNRWVQRSLEWDDYLDEIAAEARIDAIRKMNERHATISVIALARVGEKLSSINGQTMTVAEATRLLEVSAKLERTARGVPDTPKPVELSGPGGAPIPLVVPDPMLRNAVSALFGTGDTDSPDDPTVP